MNHDEQLQDSIDKKLKTADSVDAKVYRKIFDALEKEPYELPFGFADKVMRRIELRNQSSSKDYFWMGLGLLFLLAAAAGTMVYTKFSVPLGGFRFLSGYGGAIVFAIVLIMAVQWIDKTFIKKAIS